MNGIIMKNPRKPIPKRLIIWAARGMFKSASKLKAALQLATPRKVLVVRSDSPRFTLRVTDVVINWGNSNWPKWALAHCINDADQVSLAVNKLDCFRNLEGKCNIPQWTTDPAVCYEWLTKKYEVQALARKKLTGFGGDGIEEIMGGTEYGPEGLAFPLAPLYVQYKKKKKEFRVHVFKGEVIDITQKKKRIDFDGEVNTKIRNYANGWVYCREAIVEPDDLREQAIRAVQSLGLDFGAVDAIWNEKENKSYVLEINTAPGIEQTTLEAYKNAILKNLQ